MKMGKAGGNGENAEHGRVWVAGKYAKRLTFVTKSTTTSHNNCLGHSI